MKENVVFLQMLSQRLSFIVFINRTLSVCSVDHGTPLERGIMGFKIGLPSFSIFIDSFKSLDLCFNVPKYPQHALG